MTLVNRAELEAIRNHMSNIPAVGGLYAPVLLSWCEALLAEVERLQDDSERPIHKESGTGRPAKSVRTPLNHPACGTRKVCPECCYSDGLGYRNDGSWYCHRCGEEGEP